MVSTLKNPLQWVGVVNGRGSLCLERALKKGVRLWLQVLRGSQIELLSLLIHAVSDSEWCEYYGSHQNCREIEIIERWKQVSEIVERWKQVSEIVEKYFPVKSSSQNLREIEFVENMRVSFRNCREIWKQVPEIVEKGFFFNL